MCIKTKRFLPLFALLAALFAAPAAACAAPAAPGWLTRGETLLFHVTGWLGIGAGYDELRYMPQPGEAYPKVFMLVNRAWTTGTAQTFYVMRDRVVINGRHENTQNLFLPDSMHQQLNENDYRANKVVSFNRTNGKVTYDNKSPTGGPLKTFDLPPDGRELLTALYALRLSAAEPKINQEYVLPVQQLDRTGTLHVKILGRDTMDGPGGKKIAVLHVRPWVVFPGDKKKSKLTLDLWVSDNPDHLPIRVDLSFRYGTFTAKLIKVSGADAPSAAPEGLPVSGQIVLPEKAPPAYANPVKD